MKKQILFFSLVLFCLSTFGQKQICVDGSANDSGDGTPAKPYKTIQDAVTVAKNGDIVKVASGTYSENVRILQKKIQLLGGFAAGGDFNTANPQTNKTMITGSNTKPCILVNIDSAALSGSLTISGFTIQNGQRGIELSGGWTGFLNNITIENNIIENNGSPTQSLRGAGIGLDGNNVTIRNNIISNNNAGRGAAISTLSGDKPPLNFLIADNKIENNTGCDDHAGGMLLNGTGTVTRNIFDNNHSKHPDNYGWGGAICVANYDTTRIITLSHNIYRNNSAPSSGGAVFVDDRSKVIMKNELLYKNSTTKSTGSAIYVDADYPAGKPASVLYMNNCTVWGNTSGAYNGAALFVQGSIAHIQNCIFWNNGKDFEAIDDTKAIAELTVNYTLTQQGFTGTGNITSDPLFADAPNGDFHVKSKYGRFKNGQFVMDDVSSPAIDAGNPASDFSNEPQPNGGRVNLGCYGNTAEASKSATMEIKEKEQNLWKIFPNPTTGELTMDNGQWTIQSIEIFDVYGRKVLESPLTVLQSYDLTVLQPGIYFLKITTEKGIITKKVIKK